MKKKDNKKNVIIIILCITIISMGIGFMVMAMRLEGYRQDEAVFDVKFTSVRMLSSVKGGTKNPKGDFIIESSGKILDIRFQMYAEKDEVDYEVTIKNEGTVEASIVSLFSSPDFMGEDALLDSSPISVKISDISGKLLEPGEEITVKISAIYNPVSVEAIESSSKATELSGKIALLAESKS